MSQNKVMKQDVIQNELEQDQALVESLFSKKDLAAFNSRLQATPADYFDSFSVTTLQKIKQGSTKKIFHLSIFSKMAIAASFLAITISTYLFYPKNTNSKTEIAAVQINEISNEEIETYVTVNEIIAEVDWQAEISKTNAELNEKTLLIIDDSNKIKN
jgi:hypothetical protein